MYNNIKVDNMYNDLNSNYFVLGYFYWNRLEYLVGMVWIVRDGLFFKLLWFVYFLFKKCKLKWNKFGLFDILYLYELLIWYNYVILCEFKIFLSIYS